MQVLNVQIEARWLPSAVNRLADSLSRQWDPGDVRATETLLSSLCDAYEPDAVVFPFRPIGEHPTARRKYLTTQMEENWGDGKCRLWNPPFDLIPIVVRNIEHDQARGVIVAPMWPAQPWFARLRALSTGVRVQDPVEHGPLYDGHHPVNPGWKLLVAEVGLPRTWLGPSALQSSAEQATVQLERRALLRNCCKSIAGERGPVSHAPANGESRRHSVKKMHGVPFRLPKAMCFPISGTSRWSKVLRRLVCLNTLAPSRGTTNWQEYLLRPESLW
jgi:hypothetical protein